MLRPSGDCTSLDAKSPDMRVHVVLMAFGTLNGPKVR